MITALKVLTESYSREKRGCTERKGRKEENKSGKHWILEAQEISFCD